MNKSNKKRILKNILAVIVIWVVIIGGFMIYISLMTRPLPEHKRNITETDAKIEVEINDKSETRTPIIRTYKEEDYNNFDEKKIEKIIDIINGNIEGDIPAVYIKDDNDIIYITFLKDGKELDPDNTPDIEIEFTEDSSETASYTTEKNRIINDKLKQEDGKYSYKIKRYRTQYEKYFIDYNIIRIYYEIDGQKYVSIFGLNATNTDEGTDFFNNEDLETPIKPEI